VDDEGDLLFHSYISNTAIVEAQGYMKFGRYSNATDRVESYFVPTTEKYISFAYNLVFTKHYAIIWDCSVHFDLKALFDGGSFFRTYLEYTLRFGIVPKRATRREDVIWIDTGRPGGIVHPLNAWEEEDRAIFLWTPFCDNLVLDLDTEDINTFDMVEFRFDPKNNRVVSREVIDAKINIEFSAVPNMGSFTRFGYTAIQCPDTPGEGSFSGFCVWDMVKRKVHKSVYYDKHEVGGEPMVVSQNGANGYDNKVYAGT
jgi:9-cis-epoxycarotenoid dioxygenase